MIKKVIIPIAGLGTRFLPLSKVLPKELWPLADVPIIHHVLKEVKDSGVKDIIFVIKPDGKEVLEYLKPCPKTEKILKERKKENILEELKSLEELCQDLNISYVYQKRPLGDGHAILQAAKNVKEEPVGCLFSDDVFDSKEPVLFQLDNIFKTCQKPVIALSQQPKEKVSSYGIAGVEKIANRVHKIKKIIEKPQPDQAPSNLAIVGRYILTPEVFDYLKKAKPSKKGEIILAEVLEEFMLKQGKLVYGYEFTGNWLECGDKLKWLKSHFYFSLKHPKYGPELKEYLKYLK